MNTERIFNLVMMDMSVDKLKIEDDLERVINDTNIDIDTKVTTVKKLLYELSNTENAITTFSNIINNNNKKEN